MATSTITSGERYLFVSNISNTPAPPFNTHSPAPTVIGCVRQNGLLVGTREFTRSGSVLRPLAGGDLGAWEYTITALPGVTDGPNQGYTLSTGASYLDLAQDVCGVYKALSPPVMANTVPVSWEQYVSQPYTGLSGTARPWFWDGTRFYTKYTSNTSSIGTYNGVGWAGYYIGSAEKGGWTLVQWSTPWGGYTPWPPPPPGSPEEYGADFRNVKFYLMGMRPGSDLVYQGLPVTGPMAELTWNQYYFAGTWAVAASAARDAYESPSAFDLTDTSMESKNIAFYQLIVDTTPPVISGVPADIVAEATGPAGRVVTWTSPAAVDALDGSVPVVCSPASGSTFPLGDTTVTVTASDAAGNTATEQFKVTVGDTTPPSISGVPSDMVVEATGPGGAVVSWTAPTATDIVDGSVTVLCSPASGSTFPLGATTVNVTATDAAGNPSSRTFTITVEDTTPPDLTVPPVTTIEATGPDGGVVSWPPATANDLVDGPITPVCTPASGSTFPLGDTYVSVTATDSAGNSSSGTFRVSVYDTTGPELSGVPSDTVIEATGPGGAAYSWTAPTATDVVDGAVTPVCAPASGSTFPLGETIVDVTATDAHGNPTTAQFKVRVVDTTAPELGGVPSDMVVEATGPSGAVVSWTAPTATDLVDGSMTPLCSTASGSSFPLGDTIVTVSVTDAAGNPASAQFTVTVSDTTGPAFSGVPADMVIVSTSLTGAPVSWTAPTATDLVDGDRPVVCSAVSGSSFPIGDTIVSFSATDTAGNGSTARFKITVTPKLAAQFGTIRFLYNSTRLTPAAKRTLRAYARTIAASGYFAVDLRGFTSAHSGEGNWLSRIRLSAKRANNTRAYLASQLALLRVSPLITVAGYGSAWPVASNRTFRGRAKNRRVELWAR